MIPAASGHPQYSGIFIPEIWSGNLLVKFYEATVMSEICNTDYEGEIKNKGDKVNIRQRPDIIIRDYEKNGKLDVQHPEAPILEFPIEKAKYFNFICDDIDKHQSDIALMDEFSDDASEQMKIAVETQFWTSVFSGVASTNCGATAGAKTGGYNLGVTGSPIGLTKSNILDYIVDLGTVLDEANIPETGRWLVLPPWACGMIKKSELKDASITGDGTSILRNGRLGIIDRFTLYNSNLLYLVSDGGHNCQHIMAGSKHGITFASQFTKMESLRAESTFGNLVRGLNVYDWMVLKVTAVADLYAYKG